MHGLGVALGALVTLLIYPAASLNFPSNSVWNSSVTQTSPDRLDTAYAALYEGANRVVHKSVPGFGTSQLFAAMANFEYASKGNDTFYKLALQYIEGVDPLALEIREILDWGYAAIRWWRAQGDDAFRDAAVRFWNTAYQYTIFDQTMASMASLKNFSVPLHCTDKTNSSWSTDLQGATFLVRYLPIRHSQYLPKRKNTTEDNGVLSVYQSAHFGLFSALLAESDPSNSTYLLATNESLSFTLHLSDEALQRPGSLHLPWDCPPLFLNFPLGTSAAGFMIEAMATLGSMSKKEDIVATLNQTVTSIVERMSELGWFAVGNGILPNKFWPLNISGTLPIYQEQEDGDMYFLRGLAAAWRLGEKLPADLQDVIKIIMGVHYNAIQEYAKIGGKSYGRSWSPGGSNSSSFDSMYNQAAAAQILVDGIDLFDKANSSSLITPLSSSKSHTGVIAGATVGSVVFASILAITAFVFLRRHRRRRAAMISPFHDERSRQPLLRESHWHTKDRSSLPALSDSGGTRAGSMPLMMPAPSAQELPPRASEPDEHRREDMGNAEAAPNTSREDGREGTATQMEVAPGFPDLVRAVYQILWEPDGLEGPPDYRSNGN